MGSWGFFGYGPWFSRLSRPAQFALMLVAPKQLHIILFERSDGRIGVYAHYEWSPYNPFVVLWHLCGRGLDVDEGVRRAREKLGLRSAA
ncbi:hypothetical protein [Haloprofundus salinisoli]|uniref:hypothetical protein n=1 Tax=Haloprofundus salinisoli TaxID=2876193 RepID=UPI001CCC009E|nr:hypothetical protein [Haloprofundus salinisoli]